VKVGKKALAGLLALTIALPMPYAITGGQAAYAEGPNDPAPVLNPAVPNGKKVLFDNTHGQTAGAADWVIDGAFSDFGNGLAKAGYYVKELRKSTPITLDDLKAYDVFVIGEANIPYKTSEQDAMLRYVQQGGSIFFVSDHYNADRNKNRWDASEVFNGYRRGAWDNPAKGMNAEEAASGAMQGVQSSDWLASNFGVRFRYNAIGDVGATVIVPPDQSFGITNGVSEVAMHAGSTMAILDPKKAKGIVYLPKTSAAWGNAVDQGVYEGGGIEEGPYAAISKVGLGKAAFIGDSSPVEDATPKYKREENGQTKKTYDGWLEADDAKFLVNTVNWLATKESYTSLDQVSGLQLDTPTTLLPFETPQTSTEPQAEPWAAPAAGYKWYDPTTFKPGSYGAAGGTTNPGGPQQGTLSYSIVRQATLPNAQEFKIRVVADNVVPGSTISGYSVGVYTTGGAQVAQVQNPDGTWPTAFGYSSQFGMTADALGHAIKELNVRIKSGTTGAANLRLRQTVGTSTTNLKTEAVTVGNVAAEPLPADKPPVPAAISIAEARTKAQDTFVTVEGVVTTQPGSFGGQAFYLQDSTGGIYVYQNTTGYNVGDRLAITAKTTVFNTEFELTDPVLIEKKGTAEVPAPVAAASVNEANQGQLITLENVKIQNLKAAAPAGTFEFDAVKGDIVNRVRVDGRTGLTLDKFPYRDGQVVTVSGAASIFKGTYQLKPRGLFDFAADTVAPTTEAVLSGTPNESGWYAQDVTVTLNASDNVGVALTEYSTTEGVWTAYAAPIVIGADGVTTLRFRSTDGSGNVEEAKSITISLDKTAPTLSLTQEGQPVHNVTADGKVVFELNAADAHSGVAAQELLLDGVRINSGTAIDATALELGVHTVTARATDVAGNVNVVNYTFLIETNYVVVHALIDRLAADGDVANKGIATSLHAKFDAAQKHAGNGKNKQETQHLTQLLKHVGELAVQGSLSATAKDILTKNVAALLE